MAKSRISRVGTWLATVLVALFSLGAVAVAQNDEQITAEKLDVIRLRCSNSQFALGQIQKRDAVSRINRGRDYDQMLRQVSAFNSRFAYNKISSPDLLQLTTDLQSGVDKFRIVYDSYDTYVIDALKINCKEKPAEYYDVIVKARAERAAIGEHVQAINAALAKYREAVLKYKETMQ